MAYPPPPPPPPPGYGPGPQPGPYGVVAPAGETNGKAIAALALGILSLTSCCFPMGIAAIFLARSANQDSRTQPGRYTSEGLAKGGMITGIIGTVIGSLIVVFYLGAIIISAVAGSSGSTY